MEYAVLFLPLLGSIIGYFGRRLGNFFSELLTSFFVSVSAILSIIIFYNGLTKGTYGNYKIFEWVSSGTFTANWSINIDPLSSIMLVVVTSVSSLVHIYSIGYMSHDLHKPRFMSYLSLFTFSMLSLVLSDNFLQLFFGWEGVGLCSYLLIGFWYKRNSANNAAIKAFIVNRVGDGSKRPMIKGDVKKSISDLLKKRTEYYSLCHYELHTGKLNQNQIIEKITKIISN